MTASRRKRARRRRYKTRRAVEDAPLDETWERIGSWDDVRRRSVWMRVIYRDGVLGFPRTREDIERIEVKCGREGSDHAHVFDRTNPQLVEIYEMLCTMRYVVEMSRDPGPA